MIDYFQFLSTNVFAGRDANHLGFAVTPGQRELNFMIYFLLVLPTTVSLLQRRFQSGLVRRVDGFHSKRARQIQIA